MTHLILSFLFLVSAYPNIGIGKTGGSKPDSLIKKGITHISATRQGQIFAADRESNLYLFDSMGTQLYSFSPRRPARVHLLDGWNGLRPFAFYRDFQEFITLDRFLLADGPTPLLSENTGYARLVCPSQDGNLWILDESNFQLKKVDFQSQRALFSTPLDLILTPGKYSISYMREYQNQLYLCDAKGPVLQFDQMGNFKKKLPLQKLDWLGFSGEEVYCLQSDSLVFFHPYRFSIRKVALPSEISGAKELLKIGNTWFWVNENGLSFLRKEAAIQPLPDR